MGPGPMGTANKCRVCSAWVQSLLDQGTEAFAGRSTVAASLEARHRAPGARNQDDGLVGQLIEEGRSLHVFARSEHKLMVSDCHQSQDRHQSV